MGAYQNLLIFVLVVAALVVAVFVIIQCNSTNTRRVRSRSSEIITHFQKERPIEGKWVPIRCVWRREDQPDGPYHLGFGFERAEMLSAEQVAAREEAGLLIKVVVDDPIELGITKLVWLTPTRDVMLADSVRGRSDPRSVPLGTMPL